MNKIEQIIRQVKLDCGEVVELPVELNTDAIDREFMDALERGDDLDQELNKCDPSQSIQQACNVPDDWVYTDIPRCSYESWNELMDMIGEGNARLLAATEAPTYIRGQILISPIGMANLLVHVAEEIVNAWR